jgi:hypothetical protein
MARRVSFWIPLILLILRTASAQDQAAGARPFVGDWPASRTLFGPIALGDVRLGGLLGGHVDANNHRSLSAGLESAIPKGIEAVSRGESPTTACRRLATDSDFYKWLEGACYALAYDGTQTRFSFPQLSTPSMKALAESVERYAGMLARMQSPDGYLGTRLSPARPFDDKVNHDLYTAGHFFEAAVAHFKATGDRRLLAAAARLADFYLDAYKKGNPYFATAGTREHPEVEVALVRLYRATGQKRFLDFAADIARMAQVSPDFSQLYAGGGRTHAVRLCYLLTGWAELYMETGDERFLAPLRPLWDEIVSARMYVTGGIGYNEHVPVQPYDLPQGIDTNRNRDIAETCASVAMMMFSWRLHAVTGESRYFDTIETILYNHYIGAVSQDHLGIFYYNPLRRVGDIAGRTDHGGPPTRRTRLPAIHSTACCVPNAWRFFGELPEYVFSVRGDTILVNLYTTARARARLADGTPVAIEMQTDYPRSGTVRVRVNAERPVRLRLGLRIPAWCEGARAAVGDRMTSAPAGQYWYVDRVWNPGDEVALDLPMRPEPIFTRPEVAANRGQVAFRRGPIIYCLEQEDAAGLDLERTYVCAEGGIQEEFDQDLGMWRLKIQAGELRVPAAGAPLYSPRPTIDPAAGREVKLIPFYFRANRSEDTRWITVIPYAGASW